MSFDRITWLHRQLAAWQSEGLVTAEQAERIRARHPAGGDEQRHHRLSRPFAVLGGLLMSVGLILFFSSNWRAIPDAAKLIIIFGSMLGAYAVACRKQFGPTPMPGLASGLFLAGAVAYGAGIYLVAQIYNLHADWRFGLLLWGLGALPLAYAVKSRPVLWLACGTILTWLIIEFRFPETFFLCQFAGAILMLVALHHPGSDTLGRFRRIYFSLGIGFIMSSLLAMGFEDFELGFQPGNTGQNFLQFAWTLVLVYAALQVAALAAPRVRREKADRWLTWTLPALIIPGLLALAEHSSSLAFAIGVNLLMAVACVGLMFFAVAVRTKVYLNLAIVFFLTLVTVRYFDTAWEYLPRSLFFVLGGVLLLGIGYVLERKRRQWITEFGQEETA
jgi:uncharacterized membrane protein